MIVRELVTRLGFEADERKVKKFELSVKNLTKGLAALVAGATAASAAAFKLATSAARYGDEVAKTSRALGISTDDLQRYRFAFDRVGVSQQEADSALNRFNRTLGQASQGIGKGAQVMNMLGIAIRGPDGQMRSMSEIMPEVITQLRGITNEAQRAAITQELFGRGSANLVANLEGGGEQLKALGREFDALGGGLSGPQALAAEAFTDSMTNMQTAMKSLRLEVGARFMPIFQTLIESFTDFLTLNRELIMSRLERAFQILINVMRTLANVVRAVWRVIDGLAQTMGGWESTLRLVAIALIAVFGTKMVLAIMALVKGVGAASAAVGFLTVVTGKLALAMKAIPIFLIISAIALLVDELFNWVKGNETVIGRVLGSWEDFKAKIVNLFDSVVEAGKKLWSDLIAVFDASIIQPINALGDAFMSVMERIRGVWDSVTDYMREKIAGILPDWVKERLGFTTESSTSETRQSDITINAPDFRTPLIEPISPIDVIRDMTPAGNSEVRNTTLNNRAEINITVPPGTTQEQVESIRDEVNRTIERQINNAALALEVR